MSNPVIVIVGAGPGVSGSVARVFAKDGYDVGLLGIDEAAARGAERRAARRGQHRRVGHRQRDRRRGGHRGRRRAGRELGRIDVLHFNPSAFRQKDPMSLTVPELLEDVALGVGALITAVQAARPFMSAGARVTATGSMAADKPWNEAASLGVQKAGLRNLIYSLDTTLEARRHPRGLRDRARDARQGRPVHARPGRRRDPRRGPPGRGRLADRGALHGLTRLATMVILGHAR